MIKVILCGCQGRMGQAIATKVESEKALGIKIVAGVDINGSSGAQVCSFPVYSSISDFPGKADAVIDFSHHTALPALLDYSIATSTPIVVATTGHTVEEIELMKSASEKVAVFSSGNMSIGINLLIELCRKASSTLGLGFDIEIIEKHHNKKLDAPSGTALMIANAIADERGECDSEFVYDRHTVRKPRESKEIGIHSVRGGTIVGEHEVLFAGENEMITISHSAASREIFAAGALRASVYIAGKMAGLYNMTDLINNV
jgi:4-hydroxy-tetrahydrodipicolinate reductase